MSTTKTASKVFSDDQLKQMMRDSKKFAVVGISQDPARPSNEVSAYIQSQGYELNPVNPNETQVLGRKCVPALADIADKMDIVVVFRRSEAIPDVVTDVLNMRQKPNLVWLQLGIRNDQAIQALLDAGIHVVQDKCYKIDHFRLLGKEKI